MENTLRDNDDIEDMCCEEIEEVVKQLTERAHNQTITPKELIRLMVARSWVYTLKSYSTPENTSDTKEMNKDKISEAIRREFGFGELI